MSHTPLFSVVIPVHNRRHLIDETLQAVDAQTFRDFELVVVDDGSTDGTADRVRELRPDALVLRQENRGCAAARNHGAARARGVYLAFLDSDDCWLPDTLAVFAQVIHEHREPSIICGVLLPFSGRVADVAAPADRSVHATAYDDFHRGASRERWALGVAHTVIRREAYLAVGGCAEKDVNWTDSDVLFKAGTASGCVVLQAPVTLLYREHEGATTRNFDKGLAGAEYVIDQERRGAYPGGPERAHERRQQITQRTRALSSLMLSHGRPGPALRLYRWTLGWNLSLRRWRYLVAVPLAAAIPPLRRRLPTSR